MIHNEIIVDLDQIQQEAASKTLENDQFQSFLRTLDSEIVDELASQLNEQISPKIECTDCGNCCKSLMVNIDNDEANHLSAHLAMERAVFDEKYIQKGESGRMILNSIPCPFLANNACTVYSHRFAGCKEFPAFHVPQLNKRLFTTFMHYDRCPIIFNVMEQLKVKTGFKS
jgi:Fe-S-cluster containining protein